MTEGQQVPTASVLRVQHNSFKTLLLKAPCHAGELKKRKILHYSRLTEPRFHMENGWNQVPKA